MRRVLVTGATGTVGREVVAQLADSGIPVRAMARNPEQGAFPAEVEVFRADLTIPDTLDACLKGFNAVFLVWTAPLPAFAPALERIARHAERVVYVSAPLKTRHPLFQQPNPARAAGEQIEALIDASGLEWTFLRPGMFAANAIRWWGPQIRSGGVVRWPYLSVPTAPIDERDIAAVAVRALCSAGHAGSEYVITGPDSLTQAQQVHTIGNAIGRALRTQEMPPEEARRELAASMNQRVADMLLDAWAAAAGQPAFVTDTVREITGRSAHTFFDWAALNQAAFAADSGA